MTTEPWWWNNFTTDWEQKWAFDASHFLNLLSLSWLNAPGRDNRKCSWSVPQSSSHVLKKFWKLRTSAGWKRALFYNLRKLLWKTHTRYCSERVTYIGMWFASRLFRFFFYIWLPLSTDTWTLRNAGKIGQVTTGHVNARFLVRQLTFLKCHRWRIEDTKLAGYSRIRKTNCKLTLPVIASTKLICLVTCFVILISFSCYDDDTFGRHDSTICIVKCK